MKTRKNRFFIYFYSFYIMYFFQTYIIFLQKAFSLSASWYKVYYVILKVQDILYSSSNLYLDIIPEIYSIIQSVVGAKKYIHRSYSLWLLRVCKNTTTVRAYINKSINLLWWHTIIIKLYFEVVKMLKSMVSGISTNYMCLFFLDFCRLVYLILNISFREPISICIIFLLVHENLYLKIKIIRRLSL